LSDTGGAFRIGCGMSASNPHTPTDSTPVSMVEPSPMGDDYQQRAVPRRDCLICGERLGVYEPLVHLTSGVPRLTSLAAEPWVEETGDDLFHAACFGELGGLPGPPAAG
jgi:hypothetical protein